MASSYYKPRLFSFSLSFLSDRRITRTNMSLNPFASFFTKMEQRIPNGPSPPKVYAMLQPYPYATKSTSDDAEIELFPLLDDIIDSNEDYVEFNIFKLVKRKGR